MRCSTRWLLIASLIAMLAIAGWRFWPRPQPTLKVERKPELLWQFGQPERGAVISSPRLADGRVYFGAIRDFALAPLGVACAVDPDDGKVVWKFDDDGKMLKMFSSPAVADGRLFIGEGGHGDFACQLYALDAATGHKLWKFPVASHIESSPAVADGVVYFGGGDEGLFAVDAANGQRKWNFNDSLHVDSSPAIADGRVYAGSGDSRRYKNLEMFCLSCATGDVIWRLPSDLPVWGSPAVADGRVFFGVGASDLFRRPTKTPGGLICLDALTGRRVWYCDAGSAVLGRPALDATRVYFGASDGTLYAVDRVDGSLAWKANLGSGIAASPALLDDRLYVVAIGGRVACLNPANGSLLSQFDLTARTEAKLRLVSSPLVVPELSTGRHRVYFGAEFVTETGSEAAVFCLRW